MYINFLVNIVLSYLGSIAVRDVSVFGSGSGPIAFSYTQCIGNETRLVDCASGMNRRCSHFNDVGVKCRSRTGLLQLLAYCIAKESV